MKRSTGAGLQVIRDRRSLSAWQATLTPGAASDRSQVLLGDRSQIGFVPTMGALHEGHMSLIRHARQTCQKVVVSIFVNPLQFGPTEDFDKYPRTFEKDSQLCEEAGVDVVFCPTVDVLYPGGQEATTKVIPPAALERSLYGQYRPAFFSGVATVVARLFNLVQPNVAYFGEKDYQQLAVIKKMVSDMHIPVTIVGVETVREQDGLACSSRNVLLTAEQRQQAPVLYQTLTEIRDACQKSPNDLVPALDRGRDRLAAIPGVDLKYLVACNVDTLAELTEACKPMVLLVAAKFNEVWLIDTLVVR